MGFRAFLVIAIEVTRQAMAENGRKWQKIDFRGYLVGNGFPRILRHGHRGDQEDYSRKWLKMAENGFPRVSRHGHRGRKKEVR